jgi:hypothetical protein
MIEPITAAKILYELAGIAKHLFDYIDAVVEVPERTRELRMELSNVWLLLNSLREVLKSKSIVEVPLESAIKELEEMLKHMQARVDESKAKGFDRLKWPFKKDKNNELLSRIERFKATFQIALGIKTA